MTDNDDESTAKLADAAVHSVIALMQAELALLRVSVAKGFKRLLLGIGLLVLAVVVIFVGLITMADACVAVLIDAGLDAKWASASVGLALMFLAVLLVVTGVMLLKRINRTATLPLRNLQRDAQAMKAALHDK
jgi:hypothetical protein